MALFRALQGIAPHLDAAMVLNVCEGTGLLVSVRDDAGVVLHFSDEIVDRLGAHGAGPEVLRYYNEAGHELPLEARPHERVRQTGEDMLNTVSRIEGPGGAVWVQMSFTALSRGDAGYSVLGIGTDITARREAEAVLERMATRDGLTGLLNRVGLRAAAEPHFEAARRDGGDFALALLDLDHFKAVNDQHGHAVGDALLAAVAATLRAHAPAEAVVGRWGGEEFLIALPAAGEAHALAVAEQLRAAVAMTVVRPDQVEGAAPAVPAGASVGALTSGAELRVTASLGIAAIASPSPSFEALIGSADEALYAAKRSGRDRVAA